MAKNFWLVPNNLSVANWDSIRLKSDWSVFETYTPASALWYTAEDTANKENSTIDTSTTKYIYIDIWWVEYKILATATA